MGCCMSAEKATVYEVVLDHNGVARRVPPGQGTHLIHVSKYQETRMEQKPTLPSSLSSLRPPESVYPKTPKMTWNPATRASVSPVTDEKQQADM